MWAALLREQQKKELERENALPPEERKKAREARERREEAQRQAHLERERGIKEAQDERQRCQKELKAQIKDEVIAELAPLYPAPHD